MYDAIAPIGGSFNGLFAIVAIIKTFTDLLFSTNPSHYLTMAGQASKVTAANIISRADLLVCLLPI